MYRPTAATGLAATRKTTPSPAPGCPQSILHKSAALRIVMPSRRRVRWRYGQRWPGPAGTRGERSCGCSLGHPEVRDRRADRELQRGAAGWAGCSRTCCRWPTGCWSRRRPRCSPGHDVVFLALPHGAVRRRRRAARPRRARRRLRRRLPARRRRPPGRRFYGSPHAGTWPYGLPELPGRAAPRWPGASASRCPAATRPPSRWPSSPRYAAGLAEPGRRDRRRLRHLRAPARRQAAPAGQRGHGLDDARTASAAATGTPRRSCRTSPPPPASRSPSPSPRPSRRCPAASSPPAPPRPAPASPPRPCAPPTRRPYADEPFVHLLPEGQWPATAAVHGSNAVQLQVASTRPPAALIVVAPSTTSPRAPRAARCRA